MDGQEHAQGVRRWWQFYYSVLMKTVSQIILQASIKPNTLKQDDWSTSNTDNEQDKQWMLIIIMNNILQSKPSLCPLPQWWALSVDSRISAGVMFVFRVWKDRSCIRNNSAGQGSVWIHFDCIEVWLKVHQTAQILYQVLFQYFPG